MVQFYSVIITSAQKRLRENDDDIIYCCFVLCAQWLHIETLQLRGYSGMVIKRILVPFDISEYSLDASKEAVELA